jgi:hypothetical protein
MKRIRKAAALAACAVVVAALAACGSAPAAAAPRPSVAACTKAMRAEYAQALSTGAKGTEPAQCAGIPAAELDKIAMQILGGSDD